MTPRYHHDFSFKLSPGSVKRRLPRGAPCRAVARVGWCDISPMMACLTVESTGRMFFSTSSMGPGLWAIFSLRLSASRARFSLIWVACSDGSAPVSGRETSQFGCDC